MHISVAELQIRLSCFSLSFMKINQPLSEIPAVLLISGFVEAYTQIAAAWLFIDNFI